MENTLPVPSISGAAPAQPPSFVDRVMDFFSGLPIPYWLAYLLLFLLQSTLSLVISWLDGWLPTYTFTPLVLLFPFWLWAPLAMMTYLDRLALHALNTVRPLLEISDSEHVDLQRAYTHMPPRSLLISAGVWTALYFILVFLARESFFIQYHISPLFGIYIILTGLISYSVGSAIYYHSLRQLRLVNRTLHLLRHVNLFRLDPYYAFSKVTAQTGIAWVILLSVTLLTFPMQIAVIPVIALLIIQASLSLSAFVLPLWEVHQRLTAEKRRLLNAHDQRLETLLAQLHQRLDQHTLEGIDQYNDALSALQAEREVLNRIPTWPWRTGLLTGFLSALVLPIFLFILQLVLGKLLGE